MKKLTKTLIGVIILLENAITDLMKMLDDKDEEIAELKDELEKTKADKDYIKHLEKELDKANKDVKKLKEESDKALDKAKEFKEDK